MSELDALLFSNEAFYRAFADREISAMVDVWATETPISCIHPGWSLLEGLDEVLGSWEAILSNPESPAINCLGAQAHLQGEMGYVICYEEIDGNYLIATNIFVHEDRRWKLVHHQAGPTTEDPPIETEENGESNLIN